LQNNYVGTLKLLVECLNLLQNAHYAFYISVLYNHFDDSTKLFADL